MKTLKDITQTKPLKSAGKDYVPDAPIHFKHVDKPKLDEVKVNIKEIFNFFKKKEKEPEPEPKIEPKKLPVSHEAKDYHKWINHNQNAHIAKKSKDISRKLADHVKDNLNHNEIHHIKKYSNSSHELNSHLISAHKNKENPDLQHHQVIHHLDTATKRHIGHNMHLYSGLGFNPAHMMNKNGHVHLPAYTSLSHDKSTASNFAAAAAYKHHEVDNIHMLHLQVKKKDKGLHVSHLSNHESEHETILPRNTKIKIHKKPTIYNKNNKKIHVWHAHIVHQD